MSRHSTSFKAAAEVPAEAAHELLPQQAPHPPVVPTPAAQPSSRVKIRRLLIASSAVALLAAAAWYGWDYWTCLLYTSPSPRD